MFVPIDSHLLLHWFEIGRTSEPAMGLGRFEGRSYLSALHEDAERPDRERAKSSNAERVDFLVQESPRRYDLVFCQIGGESFKHWHVYQPFKKALVGAGIDPKKYSWKEFRHTTGIADVQERSTGFSHQRPIETLQH